MNRSSTSRRSCDVSPAWYAPAFGPSCSATWWQRAREFVKTIVWPWNPFDETLRYSSSTSRLIVGIFSFRSTKTRWRSSGTGRLSYRTRVASSFFASELRRADRGREVEELGLREEVLEPRDQPVEPVAPLGVLEHLDLVDHDRADLGREPAEPDLVVDPLVRPDDQRRPRVAGPAAAVLGQADPRGPDLERGLRERAVPLGKALVLLDRERDERDEEEHPPPPLDVVLEPGHLADEGLARRGGRDHEQVLAEEEAGLDRELLDRHQPLDPGGIDERARQGQLLERLRLADRLGLDPVVEGRLSPRGLGLDRREDAVDVAVAVEELVEVAHRAPRHPPEVGDLAPELAPGAGQADLLAAVLHGVLLADLGHAVLEQAEPAGVERPRPHLEVGEEGLERGHGAGQHHLGRAEQVHELLGRRVPVLAPARLPDPVLLRPDALRGLGQGDLPDRRDDPAVEEEEAIPRLGRRDDGDHRFIRSWMR